MVQVMYNRPDGIWQTEVPVTREMVEQDLDKLKTIVNVEGVYIKSAEVYVNGRLWVWEPTQSWTSADMGFLESRKRSRRG